jgi:hypothetical protein
MPFSLVKSAVDQEPRPTKFALSKNLFFAIFALFCGYFFRFDSRNPSTED